MDFLTFIGDVFKIIFGLLDLLFSSILNGIYFLISCLKTIPSFLIDFVNDLPSYFKIGYTGVFSLLVCIIFLKFLVLVKG